MAGLLAGAALTVLIAHEARAVDTPLPAPSPAASPRARSAAKKPSPSPSVAPSPAASADAEKKPGDPGYVYGNHDLPKPPSAPPIPAPGTGRGAVTVLKPGEMGPAPTPEVTPEPPLEETERYWRDRALQVRDAIAGDESRIADLEQKIAELRNDRGSVNAMDPNREQSRQAAIADAQAQLEGARADIERQRQAMNALEEEARRKSIPPGWLREP